VPITWQDTRYWRRLKLQIWTQTEGMATVYIAVRTAQCNVDGLMGVMDIGGR